MDYVEKLNIRDVLYLIHDIELRNSINKVSIEDNENQLVASNVLYRKFLEISTNTATKEDLEELTELLSKVAWSNDYNDLDNLPDLEQFKGGPTVEGTALVFDSSSEGLTPYQYEQLLAILGSGDIR